MRRVILTIVPLACVVLAAISTACSSNTPTTPTIPTPVTVTDTFSGPLTQNGGATHSFSTAVSGNVAATIVTLSPDSAVIVGLALGTWNATTSSCSIILVNDKATQQSTLLGAASGAGDLCVRVYDVGNITSPVTYQIAVAHP